MRLLKIDQRQGDGLIFKNRTAWQHTALLPMLFNAGFFFQDGCAG
jgi:hypothetical protein